jgi:hypothetical protein
MHHLMTICLAIGLVHATCADAASLNFIGQLTYLSGVPNDPGDGTLSLRGDVHLSEGDLDLEARTRYRLSARLALPSGLTLSPVLENSSGFGPRFITVDVPIAPNGITLQERFVTPPVRLGPFLRRTGFFDDASAAVQFLTNNRSGSQPIGSSMLTWDIATFDLDLVDRSLKSSFTVDLTGPDLEAGIGTLFTDFVGTDTTPLFRLLNRQGNLPAICPSVAACANNTEIVGLASANIPFEIAATLTPVPVPGALPLLGSGIALLGLLRRRRESA